jgi:Alginate export
MRSGSRVACAVLLAMAATAYAEDKPEDKPAPPPGLPAGVDWTFNFDGAIGGFGFGNSLYTNPKPDEPSGDLSDNWMEGSIKPALSGEYTTSSSSQIYGKVSAVGERTYGASPSLVGGDANSFGVEDLYIGWRSGKSLEGLGENALDFTVGRTQYKLGHGLLLWDGASEGGSRGGYWSNVRKAFDFAAIGRLHTGNNRLEVFYLDKDELPESDSHTKLTGVNYEYAIGEDTTLGATYINLSADPTMRPERDGLNVYNLRAFTAPFPNLKALSFEAEYAKEDNGDKLDSEAWNVQVAWQFESSWMPKLSYRYAFFQGDDPTTSKNEAFDGLLTGFYDWGTWWQGEIAGEYFVSNSNLITNQLRLHAKPTENIGTGLMFFDFKLDNPQSAGVTSDSVATELDWYMDWTVNPHFIVSFVAAVADPGKAVEQSSGRTDTFVYGMIYAAYSF